MGPKGSEALGTFPGNQQEVQAVSLRLVFLGLGRPCLGRFFSSFLLLPEHRPEPRTPGMSNPSAARAEDRVPELEQGDDSGEGGHFAGSEAAGQGGRRKSSFFLGGSLGWLLRGEARCRGR